MGWGTSQTYADGNTNHINALLDVSGDGGTEVLNVSNAAATAADTNDILTSTTLSGLGMAGSITYGNVATLNVWLGKGQNIFTIANTDATTTNLYGGPAGDTITIATVSGQTFVYGGAGNDTITKQAYADTATLNIDGGLGSNTINVSYAGTGNYLVNVTDTGTAPTPVNLTGTPAGTDLQLTAPSTSASMTFDPSSSSVVDTTDNTITLPGNIYTPGQMVTYRDQRRRRRRRLEQRAELLRDTGCRHG